MKIGRGAVIGFGSVVVDDIPENAVAVGNPARVIKDKTELNCVMKKFERPYMWE